MAFNIEITEINTIDKTFSYLKNLEGTQLEVLFEETDGDFFTGHAPNYVKVYARGENLHNEIRTVTVTGPYKDGVAGSL